MTDTPIAPTPARKRWPYFVPLIVLAVLFGIFGKRLLDVERGADPHAIPSVLVGKALPSFDLPGLPGRADDHGLKTDDFKGQVSILNVWGSWCIACMQEHPRLLELARADSIPIDGIDWRDTPEAGLAWLKQHGDPYARVGQDPHSEAAIALGITGAPESFLIDKDGRIVFKWANQITPEVWEREFAPRIAQLRK